MKTASTIARLALSSVFALVACNRGCDGAASNDGPDAPNGGDGGSGSDGGSGTDGGGPDGATTMVTPVCHVYGPGGPNTEVPGNGLTLAGGRLYWGTSAAGSENQVHSIKTDFTDYKRYDNQTNVAGFAANSNGVFWLNRAADSSGGLYRLSSETPQLVTAISVGGLLAADAGNVIYVVRSGLDFIFHRAPADGTNGTSWFSGSLNDQLVIRDGFFYFMATTIEANVSTCPTPATQLRQVSRVPAGPEVPSAIETAMNGCAVLAVAERPTERLQRIVTDGTSIYATSSSGNVYKSAVTGGAVTRIFQPLTPGQGGSIMIVGSNLVWLDDGSTVGGVERGFRKMPLAGGASSVFALPHGGDMATDGTSVYFVTHQQVCRLAVP